MQNKSGKDYAIVPAAGLSRRMGVHKLLLPWPTSNRPSGLLIDHILDVWTTSCLHRVVVVVRADDERLANACRAWPVTILQPSPAPTDMKASIQHGVRHIAAECFPVDLDRCFVAPADLPGIGCDVVRRLTKVDRSSTTIVTPRYGKKTGHPVLIPWLLLGEVFELAKNEGVNRIVDRHEKQEVQFPVSRAFSDVDTPEQYEEALRRWTQADEGS